MEWIDGLLAGEEKCVQLSFLKGKLYSIIATKITIYANIHLCTQLASDSCLKYTTNYKLNCSRI